MKILNTITLARCEDGKVRQLTTSVDPDTANVIEQPLSGLIWDDSFLTIPEIDKPKVTQPAEVIAIVQEYFKLPAPMQTRSRKRDYVAARQFVAYFLRMKTNLSYREIGEEFGMDHSSTIHSVEKVNDLLKVNEESRTQMTDLAELLRTFPDIHPRPYNNSRFTKLREMARRKAV